MVLLNAFLKFIFKDTKVGSSQSGMLCFVAPVKISKFTWFEKWLALQCEWHTETCYVSSTCALPLNTFLKKRNWNARSWGEGLQWDGPEWNFSAHWGISLGAEVSRQWHCLHLFLKGRNSVHKAPIDLSETFQGDVLAGAHGGTSLVAGAESQREPLLMLVECMA